MLAMHWENHFTQPHGVSATSAGLLQHAMQVRGRPCASSSCVMSSTPVSVPRHEKHFAFCDAFERCSAQTVTWPHGAVATVAGLPQNRHSLCAPAPAPAPTGTATGTAGAAIAAAAGASAAAAEAFAFFAAAPFAAAA